MRLSALAKLQRLPAKRPLVDLALGGPREWHAVVLELNDRVHSRVGHVRDGVLVAEPVRALDSVVEQVPRVVVVHRPQRGVDSALRSHRVAPRREESRDAEGVEAGLLETHRSPETRATGTHHHSVHLVVHNFILLGRNMHTPHST